MIRIDPEAGGKALYAETFPEPLPLFPTWDEQPEAFRDLMRRRAVAVTCATVVDGLDQTPLPNDPQVLRVAVPDPLP